MRKRWLAGILGAAALLASPVAPAAAATAVVGQTVWFPAGSATTTGAAVQVAVEPVTGYTGGTVGGKATAWVQVPSYLVAAMDVQARLLTTPAGWVVPSLGAGKYGLVVAMKYAGQEIWVGGAPAVGKTGPWWTTATPYGGALSGSVTYPAAGDPPNTTAQPTAPTDLPAIVGVGRVAPAGGNTVFVEPNGTVANVPPGSEAGGYAPGQNPDIAPGPSLTKCLNWEFGGNLRPSKSFVAWWMAHYPTNSPSYNPKTDNQMAVYVSVYGAPSFGPNVAVLDGTCTYTGK